MTIKRIYAAVFFASLSAVSADPELKILKPAEKKPATEVKAPIQKEAPPLASPVVKSPQTMAAEKERALAIKEALLIADKVQAQYNRTTSAEMPFTQNYKHPFLPLNESSSGIVFYSSGNMLWRYLEPANRKKEFYIEGKEVTYYPHGEKNAYSNKCFDKSTLPASITFLWGKGKIKESFNVLPYQGSISNPLHKGITLIAKEANPAVKSISLIVQASNGQVMESIVTDQSDGVNHFIFSNIKTNPKLDPKIFRFVPPAGVTIVPMPNVDCPANNPQTEVKAATKPEAPVKKAAPTTKK
jgi:outer membrane lipoprotein-sorting protein